MGTTDPTVLPIRKMPLVLVYDRGPLRPLRGSAFGFGQPDRFATGAFLDNHEIAFGVIHFALRRFPRWCARRWGRYCPPMHGRVGGTLSHQPALVVDPNLCENRRKPYRLHRLGAMFGFQALPCTRKMRFQGAVQSELPNTERHCAERQNTDRQ